MIGGNRRRKLGRWTGAVLLAVAVSFLVARVVPSQDGGSAAAGLDDDLPTYPAGEAAAHAGEVARVCGTVESASWTRSIEGRPTFLNLGRPYPDQPFTVVIWGRHRDRFGTPERRYDGRRICVAGRIRTHEGTPQIDVEQPAQIGVRPPSPGDEAERR